MILSSSPSLSKNLPPLFLLLFLLLQVLLSTMLRRIQTRWFLLPRRHVARHDNRPFLNVASLLLLFLLCSHPQERNHHSLQKREKELKMTTMTIISMVVTRDCLQDFYTSRNKRPTLLPHRMIRTCFKECLNYSPSMCRMKPRCCANGRIRIDLRC